MEMNREPRGKETPCTSGLELGASSENGAQSVPFEHGDRKTTGENVI